MKALFFIELLKKIRPRTKMRVKEDLYWVKMLNLCPARKLKYYVRRLNNSEEYLRRYISFVFDAFFRIYLAEHIKYLPDSQIA